VSKVLNPDDSNKVAAAIGRLAAMRVVSFAVSSLAETRASGSGKRILRLQHYVMALTNELKRHERFAHAMSEAFLSDLFQSIPVYDIGKIGIPDRILLKPNALTPEEFEIMKTHTTLARDAIELAEMTLSYRAPTLQTMKDAAYSHHEKWDGSGYPRGLSGEAIPLSARLVAIADVYDALISNKVYRNGIPHDDAVQAMRGARGKHFDPELIDAFVTVHEEFRLISSGEADTDMDNQRKIDYLARSIADQAEMHTIVGVSQMPWS